ncbi:MAG: AraC family regulatory protein [Holophagaceae bacterium]|nr:AraC family regulatory protein [Holophagaceae bacterium]
MPHPSLKQEIQRVLGHYFEDLQCVMKDEGLGELFSPLLTELGLQPEDLGDTAGGLTFEHYLSALKILDAREHIPGLGLKVGALKRCGTYGFTGVAFLTQSTFDQVHEFAITAFEICYGRFLRLNILKEGPWIRSRYELSPPSLALFAPLIEQTLMTGYRTLSEVLPGKDWSECRAHFAFPPPPYLSLYTKSLPFPCLFDQPHNELCCPASWDTVSSNLAEDHIQAFCTTHFQAMLAEGRELPRLEHQIRRILMEAPADRLPKINEIATQLRMPERTLRARLAQEDTSFRAILNEVVIERAKEMLSASRALSIKEIAFHLGFSQPSNFNRAFAKSTGFTPAGYRARQG